MPWFADCGCGNQKQLIPKYKFIPNLLKNTYQKLKECIT